MDWNSFLHPTAPHSAHSKPLLAFCHAHCLSVYAKGCLSKNSATKSPFLSSKCSCSEEYFARLNCILDIFIPYVIEKFFESTIIVHTRLYLDVGVVKWLQKAPCSFSVMLSKKVDQVVFCFFLIFSPVAFQRSFFFSYEAWIKKMSSLWPWHFEELF